MASRLLSKSKYLAGLRCPLLLWTTTNDFGKIPPVSPSTQHRFDEGNLVGNFAKKLFPEGVDIPTDSFMGNIHQTEKAISARRTIFEAGILSGRLYSRADILNPVENSAWDIYEVKSSTSIRETNIHDVAFQKHVYQQAGISIRRCFLIYIDTDYVKYGELDPERLFTVEDISGAAQDAACSMEERIGNMLAIMDSKSRPERTLGSYCLYPWECDLKPVCWEHLPKNHIFELAGSRTKQFLLYEQGIIDIRDIPDGTSLTDKQMIQKICATDGKVHIDKQEICRFLETIKYPRYYLEIKTVNPAIPVYDGTRPYQHVPFQFSLHVVSQPGALPVHHFFLANGSGDPRLKIVEKLAQLLGQDGSIIVCEAREKVAVLQELSAAFPRYKKWVEDISPRMIDLLTPFSNFDYYHASQKNADCLEKVLTAIINPGCEDTDERNETRAGIIFTHILSEKLTPDELSASRQCLLDRCKQETMSMIQVADRLREVCSSEA